MNDINQTLQNHSAFQEGIITAINDDSYDIRQKGRDFAFKGIRSCDGQEYQIGDPVLLLCPEGDPQKMVVGGFGMHFTESGATEYERT